MIRPDGIRRLFRLAPSPRTAARDVDEELRFHLDTRVAELVASGRSRADAERVAAREFGDVGAARDELTAIDQRRLRRDGRAEWWSGWTQDVRYAVRALRRQPAFAAAVLLTIALGVGANAAIFSVTDAALLRPLPYRAPDRLVHLWQTSRAQPTGKSDVSYPNFLDWQRQARSFAGLAGYHANRMVLAHGDRPRVLSVGKTSANFFDVLGVRPALGRAFATGEDAVGAPRVVVLSHGLWAREFAADPGIVGRAVSLDGAPYTVLGVLPEPFQFARVGDAEAWVPFDRGASARERRGMSWLNVIGRLAPGVTIERARQDMTALGAELARRHPDTNADETVVVNPLRDELTGAVRPLLLVLFGAAGFVLLVALANVASLLLVRGTARRKELAVRASLGAGRGRIVRQLLTESLVLAGAGGALGVALAHVGVRALVGAIPAQRLTAMPYLAHVGVDGRLLAYAALLSVAAGLVLGVVPTLRVVRPSLADVLRQGARGTSDGGGVGRTRDGLVAAEIALTVVLVTGAALFGKSLARVLAVDPGFRAERVFTAQVPLPRVDYASAESQRRFFETLDERVRALPGVDAAGLTSKLPLDWGNSTSVQVVGEPVAAPGHSPSASFRSVTTGYFRALGIPLVRGRLLDAQTDSAAPREIVVSAAFARALVPGDPIGRQVALNPAAAPWTIVGVVGDVAIGKIEDEVPPVLYLPFARSPEVSMRLAVRARGASVEAAVRRIVHDIDPQVALYQASTMEAIVAQSESVFMRRFPLLLVGAFAATALALAIVGTYGVISYAVAQRNRELGIRIALGASSSSVVSLVVRHAAALAGAGIVTGVIAAASLSRFASSLLYGVRATDPGTYALAALALGVVAAAAAAIPARRATRVDPAVTLRGE